MKEYEIWIEGYAATGESGPANFIGKSHGEDFTDACVNFRYPDDIYSYDKSKVIVPKGTPLNLDKDSNGELRLSNRTKGPMIWACALFDNEVDARKSYG
jgi:hypothetical protein